MEVGVIISLLLAVASIISSIFYGLIPGIRKAKMESMEKKLHTFAQDIDSFYAIEQSLLEQLSAATGKNAETLKKTTRKQISKEKGHSLSQYACPSGIASEL